MQKHRRNRLRKQSSSNGRAFYTQNRNRNVFPNVARLIINFVCLQAKSERHLRMIYPDASDGFVKEFYREAGKLKSKFGIYIARHKLFDFLGFEPADLSSEPVNSGSEQSPSPFE